MVSIDEARRIVLSLAKRLPDVNVPLLESLGMVLAEDVHSPWDIPSADNSAMDGYAYSHDSLQGLSLQVCGFLPAGTIWTDSIPPGQTIKIMTGAQIPPGCDTVVPVEDVQETPDGITLKGASKPGSHVRKRGEDVGSDELVLNAGTLIRPQEVGMLASFGKTEVHVYRKPVVAILATGDELVEPGDERLPGKIINSNSFSVAAQVLEAGGRPLMLGIASDDREITRDMLLKGLQADVIITSGGVSVGDHDFVKEVIEEMGGELKFWKINMKPGKPLAFAVVADKPLFALPGNPVAAMVGFEMFVRPALLAMMGHTRIIRPLVRAVVTEQIRNKGDRPHLIRALVELQGGKYHLKSTGNQGSARLSSLTLGNALTLVPAGTTIILGNEIDVSLLDRSFEMQE
ncbi:MAG: molybdopterin molybdotransferase MoeA [Deltaproteobacteria bacterium]|nr:molybdopterin molybdotransferase MoeA [Deltaproteobacteria bacterium]